MAISIVTQPTYPNASYTNLVYAVSSSLSENDQYQYVMDVTQNDIVLVRTKQYPNPQGNAIFDPARIINDYLSYDASWQIDNVTGPLTAVQTFVIKFGEEYGTSPSSSVTLYNGSGGAGAPGVSGSDAIVFPGVIDPNNGVGFNWVSSSQALTNMPNTQTLSYDDYLTMAFYTTESASDEVEVDYNPGATLTYDIAASSSNGFAAVPISTKNIEAGAAWDEIVVTYNNETWTFTKDEECNYDRIRFAFVNNYGMWDYYGFNLPIRKQTTMDRQMVDKPFVNYGSNSGQYDVNRRGKDYYNTQYTDSISVTTPLIDKTTAEWLSEMLESPSVFVQENDNFVPIIITNASYNHYTNLRGQKTFQYDISFQYSNQRIGR